MPKRGGNGGDKESGREINHRVGGGEAAEKIKECGREKNKIDYRHEKGAKKEEGKIGEEGHKFCVHEQIEKKIVEEKQEERNYERDEMRKEGKKQRRKRVEKKYELVCLN